MRGPSRLVAGGGAYSRRSYFFLPSPYVSWRAGAPAGLPQAMQLASSCVLSDRELDPPAPPVCSRGSWLLTPIVIFSSKTLCVLAGRGPPPPPPRAPAAPGRHFPPFSLNFS